MDIGLTGLHERRTPPVVLHLRANTGPVMAAFAALGKGIERLATRVRVLNTAMATEQARRRSALARPVELRRVERVEQAMRRRQRRAVRRAC